MLVEDYNKYFYKIAKFPHRKQNERNLHPRITKFR